MAWEKIYILISSQRNNIPYPNKEVRKRPCIGQGRAGSGRKRPDPINQSINQPSNLSQKIPGRTEIETRKTNHVHTKDLMHSINNANGKMTNDNPLIPDIPFHPGPVYRPLPNSSSKMYHILKVYMVQLI